MRKPKSAFRRLAPAIAAAVASQAFEGWPASVVFLGAKCVDEFWDSYQDSQRTTAPRLVRDKLEYDCSTLRIDEPHAALNLVAARLNDAGVDKNSRNGIMACCRFDRSGDAEARNASARRIARSMREIRVSVTSLHGLALAAMKTLKVELGEHGVSLHLDESFGNSRDQVRWTMARGGFDFVVTADISYFISAPSPCREYKLTLPIHDVRQEAFTRSGRRHVCSPGKVRLNFYGDSSNEGMSRIARERGFEVERYGSLNDLPDLLENDADRSGTVLWGPLATVAAETSGFAPIQGTNAPYSVSLFSRRDLLAEKRMPVTAAFLSLFVHCIRERARDIPGTARLLKSNSDHFSMFRRAEEIGRLIGRGNAS